MDTGEWLAGVKEALSQDGFTPTPLQTIKAGQVFGLVKKLDKVWQMHVRGFSDGRLEAEIEISRNYLEHFNDKYRRDATPELVSILDAHGISYQTNGSLPQMSVILHPPEQLTAWKPIVVLAAVAGFLIWLGNQKG